ncbi:hypothetical protein C1645_288054 [Glomus cerebriforme]|uniref:LITAF domain-containing protein n=1 Tax=Glomus cerebriforme TaxID=658196 RepID=A0A397TK18_9GLOM|nr:hypothetical protein C1645_288054 [Glomus cerebriforme]
MSNSLDTKSSTDSGTTVPEPPPPHSPPSGDPSSTNSSRDIRVLKPYGGGTEATEATEATPLIQQQQEEVYGRIPMQVNPISRENLRDKAALTTCPHCRKTVKTRITDNSSCCSTLCCFIPFCTSREVSHFCPSPDCNKFITTWHN